MVGRWIGEVPGSLALVAQRGRWWRLSWNFVPAIPVRRRTTQVRADDPTRRFNQFRYHLGRGRRAREVGRFEQGAVEARRALALYPTHPWALALLGQCLQRQRSSDLAGARRALEKASALDPSNGYFVGLLLGVLQAQGDVQAAHDLLTWAWWHGAPVERWLPVGPPMPERQLPADVGAAAEADARRTAPPAPTARPSTASGTRLTGRQPVPA